MADTLSLLIGGAIGFVAAVLAPIIVEPLKHCFYDPKLNAEFIEDDRGFITDTKDNGVTDAHYVRVKVLNTSRQIAKQCRAYLVNVEKWNTSTGEFEPTTYCDSLQLGWSAQLGKIAPYRALDIPKGIPQFIDIVSTRKGKSDYFIKTKLLLNRYDDLFKERGKFRYTMRVSGDNARPKSTKVIFEWSGDWDKFTATAG